MTLTRGARITGAVLCAVLALMVAAWIVRDIRAADGPGPVWDYWSGTGSLGGAPRPTTSATSLVLLVAYVAAAVAALRSASAASALVVTGVVTFALRLPSTWIIADAPAPEELRDRALLTTYVVLAASVALIVAGVAGRRPVPEGEERPAGPGRGAGVAAFLLLGFQAVVFAGWEIRQPFIYPSELYPAWFIGGKPLTISLTEGPPGWVTGVHILIFLVAAVGAVAGAAYARPLGLIGGGFVLASGVLGVTRIIRFEMYERFFDMKFEAQLNMLSFVSSLLIAPIVLLVLALKGGPRTPGGSPGPWGGAGPWGVQPPGYPPAAGPGVPPQAPGHPPAPAPGFGPPPPSSPPPRS
ncbi:hypothetical protein [Streptomyces sp. PTY087I2]|uniref:hypothetical protein n=1 Tax=Streptomyces sp. PTY087I2 TaxID=1819298 RepID=UPI000827DE78|nr:hypothetical protein [Streptomyces sp. PTY087I2]OCC07963.1 hypothetical protein A3Q37_06283 [Streptomyces sp. PTY087I2]